MTGAELELLTDVDRLLLVEKAIGGRICHAIYRYTKASNKYMIEDFHQNKELSCLMN